MKIKDLKDSDLFYQDLELRIDSIKSKKNKYIILYRATKIIVFVAGVLITILTGWKMYNNDKFDPDNYVLVISSCVTFLAAIEGLFSFKDKGKSYDFLLFDLRRLRDRICFDYLKGADVYIMNKDRHFEEYQKILETQKSIIENSDIGEQ